MLLFYILIQISLIVVIVDLFIIRLSHKFQEFISFYRITGQSIYNLSFIFVATHFIILRRLIRLIIVGITFYTCRIFFLKIRITLILLLIMLIF